MKRQEFVRNLLALSGTAFVYGCTDNLEFASPLSPNAGHSPPIDASEAEKWFNKTYIPKFQNPSLNAQASSIERSLKWNSSVEVRQNTENFVWVPITYNDPNEFPTLVTWRDGQEYVRELAKFLKWYIAEGFIFYKDGEGKIQGSIVQVVYDPFKHKPGKIIDSRYFTGMIIHANWDESPLRVWRYSDGHLESYFDSDKAATARVEQCVNVYYSYQTYSGFSCGPNCYDFTVTLHREVYTICDGDEGGGNTGSGGQGYPYYPGGGGGGQGNGGTPPVSSLPSPGYPYNYGKVARHEGDDYQIFMQRLNVTLQTLSISSATFGTSYTYAEVFIRTLGMEDAFVMNTYKHVVNASRTLGWAGVAIGSVQLVISLADGEPITNSEYLLGASIVFGAAAVLTPIGWVAITAGGISALLGFYAE